MKSMTQKQQKELEETFRKEGVVLAYLFGSQARGSTHHFSDTDIGVLLDNGVPKETYLDKTLILMEGLARVLENEHVDVVILNRAKPFLRSQVVFGGQLLFERDTGTRVFFENRTVKEYEDTKHILRFSLNAMRERIRNGTFGINVRSLYGARS